jgi:hypothetical protein
VIVNGSYGKNCFAVFHHRRFEKNKIKINKQTFYYYYFLSEHNKRERHHSSLARTFLFYLLVSPKRYAFTPKVIRENIPP